MPVAALDPGSAAELDRWLDTHALPPAEYITSEFRDHDVVFLGEHHRIRRDPLFVQSLIPALHAADVRLLGLEFACASDQPLIDSLLVAPEWDEALARRIQWSQWPWWGYREYVDIHRAAWELNRSLEDGEPRFRVLGLNARVDWSHVRTPADRERREVMRVVFAEGDPDSVMARTILEQVVARGEKGLVYAGINHSYTRFGQPIWSKEEGFVRRVSNRMGNIVYAAIGDRCCTLFLHSPWPSAAGYDKSWVRPAEGVIDAVMEPRPPARRSVGFDVSGSPFAGIELTTSFWAHGDSPVRLGDWCDGWIFLGTLGEAKGVTLVEGWFTEENRLEAIAQLPNADPRVKNPAWSVEDLVDDLASTTRIERRFRRFR